MKQNKIEQKTIVIESLSDQPKTRQEVSRETGIPINSVCSLVNRLIKHKRVGVFLKAPCRITGIKAEYLTSDPALMPQNKQTDIF